MPEEHKHEYRQTGVVLTFECRDCLHGYSKTITFGGEIYPNVEINPETIAAERKRQIALGYTPEHDRKHGLDHLLIHGLSYLEQGEGLKAAALFQAARELIFVRSQRWAHDAPWNDPAGCFGHCDPEGWYSPCVSKAQDDD